MSRHAHGSLASLSRATDVPGIHRELPWIPLRVSHVFRRCFVRRLGYTLVWLTVVRTQAALAFSVGLLHHIVFYLTFSESCGPRAFLTLFFGLELRTSMARCSAKGSLVLSLRCRHSVCAGGIAT